MTRTEERSQLRADVGRLVEGLGRDAGEVASSLQMAGVRGARHDVGGCPLTTYLRAVMGADSRVDDVRVHAGHATVGRRWSKPVKVPLPGAARDFVVAFDRGEFPKLVRSYGDAGEPLPRR